MRLVGDIALDAEVRAIASGAITDGAPVVVNADGTVSVVSSDPDSLGSATDLYDGGFSFPAVVYDTGQDKFLLVYTDDSNSYYGTGVVGTVSGSSISFGTPVVFSSATSYYISASFDSNAGKTGIFWSDFDDGQKNKACVATISGTSVSYGSTVTFNSTASNLKDSTFDSSQNKIVVVYRKDSSNGEVVAATISGTDISFGTGANLYGTQNGSFNKVGITYDSNAGKSLVVFHNPANSDKLDSKVVSLSGSTVSLGSLVNVFDGTAAAAETAYDSTNNKVIVAYRQDDTESDVFSRLVVGTISGTSVSYGTAVSLGRGFQTGDPGNSLHYDASAQKVIFVGGDIQDSYKGKYVKATVSGTSISIDSITTFSTRSVRFANFYDPDAQKSVLIYNDHASASSDPVARTLTVGAGDNITSENYIGIANAAYADGQKATIKTTGSIARNVAPTAVAVPTPTNRTIIEEVSSNYLFRSTTISLGSGKFVILYTIYLGSGEPVVYYKVGTIDQATNTVSYSDRTSTNAFTAYSLSGILDTNANRIVVVYENGADGKGYAAVGTVSGNTISFGTPVVFEDDVVKEINLTFDSTANKVIISWRDQNNSNYGTAIVATVDNSDNSISFGTAVVYESAYTITFPPNAITYDSNSNRVVIVYRDVGDSNKGKAIVGTVSGTSISFGTAVDVDTGNPTDYLTAVFNPDVNKVLITYDASDKKGKSKIGTVSGTGISLTGVTIFNNDTNNDGTIYQSSCYDTTSNTHLIVYRDNTLSGASTNHVYGIIGTMNGDGSAISYGTEFAIDLNAVINPGGNQDGNGWKTQCIYDSTTERFIVVYDFAVLKKLAASMIIPIGGEVPLTIGQQYFVQIDGSLGTSADDPSVIAGTAIGTSDIIVKG